MYKFIKIILFSFVIKPFVWIALGLNIKRFTKLNNGPMIIASNHNSHLDALVIMSLFSNKNIAKVRPVAAADYFCNHPLKKLFFTKIMGIIPLDRHKKGDFDDCFNACKEALNNGDIILVFPEGTRGKPEEMGRIRKGIHALHTQVPDIPIIPIVTHGLGKSLPKGEALFVPFNCDIIIGRKLDREESTNHFTHQLQQAFQYLLTFSITKHDANH